MSDLILEKLVIGFLFNYPNPASAEPWMARLDAECFTNIDTQTIFKAMTELVNFDPPQSISIDNVMLQIAQKHKTCNVTSVDMMLMKSEAIDCYDITLHINILRDYKVRRALFNLAQTIQKKVTEIDANMSELVDEAIRTLDLQDVSNKHCGVALHQLVEPLKQRVNDNQNDPEMHHGPWTGVEVLDRRGGLPESGLVVLAGGTSQGKSALASSFTLHSADHGIRTAYFSMELNNLSLSTRLVAMHGRGVSAEAIKSWKLMDSDWRKTLADIDSMDEHYGNMVYFDDNRSSNLSDICAGIRYMKHAYGIKMVVVDFLQLLNYTMAEQRNTTTEQLMGQAARTFKNLGDRLGICIVVLCQINRSMEHQRPSLSVIRDSGQIAEAADMVIFTWRPSAYHGSYDLDFADYRTKDTLAFMVCKNREGALMDRLLKWDGKHTLALDIPDHQLPTFKNGFVSGEKMLDLFED